MKVCVDQSKCQTVGVCVQICPEVFQFQQGSKKAIARIPIVRGNLQQQCREAARKCPNNAICIIE